MRNLSFVLIMLFVAVVTAEGQIKKTDSLLKVLSITRVDTTRVQLLCSIGEAYENTEPETAKLYLRQAAAVNRKLDYPEGEYRFLDCYGGLCLIQGEFDSSIYYQKQALVQARILKDSLKTGLALFNIGIGYREMADFDNAVEYLLQGRKILEQIGNARILMKVNDALQLLYVDRRQYDKAIEFGEKALAQARQSNERDLLPGFLNNLGISYRKTSPEKARKVFEESLQIAKELKNLRDIGTIEINLAWLAIKQHNISLARTYAESSWAINRQIGNQIGEAQNLYVLALCNLQEGRLSKAKDYVLQSLSISRDAQFKVEEINALRLLSSIEYVERNYAKGYDYDDTMVNKIEDMLDAALSQKSAALEKQYETEQKESRIRQLEAEKKLQTLQLRQKNIFNHLLTGGALTLSVIIVLLYLNYRQKQDIQQKKIQELETEKQLEATESVLRGEEQERARLARDLHDGLGGILSGIKYSFNTMKGNLIMTPENQEAFERSLNMLDTSIHEMRRVAHNLMPEALVKFGLDTALRDFCNDINQSGSVHLQYQSVGLADAVIDSNTSISVYRIVQELVNNILKHAEASTALVQLIKSDTGISITVEDDGKGLNTALLPHAKGIGWSNIYSRVNYLKGTMDIKSDPGEGTSVFIELSV